MWSANYLVAQPLLFLKYPRVEKSITLEINMDWADKDSLLEERDLRKFRFGQIQSEVLSNRIRENVS